MNPQACCFAGMNPKKLSHGYDEHQYSYLKLKALLANEIEAMVKRGVTTFLTGMIPGPDTWCAEIVLDMKKFRKSSDILLMACLPYEDQAAHWSVEDRERYFNTLLQVDDETILQTRYTKDCMYRHKQCLVDASSHMIAVYDGGRGDPRYMMNYAIHKGLGIVTFHPMTLVRDYLPGSK